MPASNLIKIVAAFAAGILVALGSALVYMRVNDAPKYQPPSIVVPPSTADTPPRPSPAADDEAAPPPPRATSTPQVAKRTTHPAAVVHKAQPKRHSDLQNAAPVTPAPKPAPEPVQIAQNSPVAPPPYGSAPPVSAQAAVSQSSVPSATPAVAQTAPEPPPVRQPHVVTLPPGTTLAIRLAETVSTDHNYTGDAFRGNLDAPIIMDGFIIADKGSKVLGKIVNAEKGGHLSKVADLTLALTEIHTTDGQTVQIDTNTFDKQGPKNTMGNAEKIGGGAALGAIIGAIAGGGKGAAIGAGAGGAAGTGVAAATHGKAATLPSETKITFQLSNPVTITEKLH